MYGHTENSFAHLKACVLITVLKYINKQTNRETISVAQYTHKHSPIDYRLDIIRHNSQCVTQACTDAPQMLFSFRKWLKICIARYMLS